MYDLSEGLHSQQDSDIEPVQKNVELPQAIPPQTPKPVYVPKKKTFGICALSSKEGKNPIGAPSTINIKIDAIGNEDAWSEIPKLFNDVDSHKTKPTAYNGQQFKDIETFDREHPLRQIFEKTSWNNIPIPLKDCIYNMMKAMASLEIQNYKRKKIVNERFIEIHKCNDKLKKKIKNVLAESRAQGIFIQEQIAEIFPQTMFKINAEIAQMKFGPTQEPDSPDDKMQDLVAEVKKMVEEQSEKLETVEKELQNFSKTIQTMEDDLPSKMQLKISDFMNKWEKVPMPEDKATKDKVTVDIKEYLALLPKDLGQDIKSLEGKLVDKIDTTEQNMQQDFVGRIEQITTQQLEVNDQIRDQIGEQIKTVQKQIELQIKTIRQEIKDEGDKIRKEEQERRIRERPTSAEIKEKEQRQMELFKEVSSPDPNSKDDPITIKLGNIVKMIFQIREEFVPQKITRAIEQLDGKLEIQDKKNKKTVKDSIAKVEKNSNAKMELIEKEFQKQKEKIEELKKKTGLGLQSMFQDGSGQTFTTPKPQEQDQIKGSVQQHQTSRQDSKISKNPTQHQDSRTSKVQSSNIASSVLVSEESESRQISRISAQKKEETESEGSASDKQSEGGDYMEAYVQQTIKNRCDPLDDQNAMLGQMIKDIQKQVDQLLQKDSKQKEHFNLTIRALCSTMGLVVKDVTGFDIQQSFIKKLDNEQTHRNKIKLGVAANADNKNEYLKVMHQNETEHRSNSMESSISEIDKQLNDSVASGDQLNKSQNSENRQWRVYEKKFTVKGVEQRSYPMETPIRINQSLDDSLFEHKSANSQNKQYEALTHRQQVVHTSGKQETRTLMENFLPPMKTSRFIKEEEKRLNTVQLTERYQKRAEFTSFQFPDVVQAQRSVNEPVPSRRYIKPDTANYTSIQQAAQKTLVTNPNLNIKRALLPNK